MVTMEATGTRRIRVAVVDNQILLREGIISLLQMDPRMQVVGRGDGSLDVLNLIAAAQPDVVLVDIHVARSDGIQVIREVKRCWPDVRVVILTTDVQTGFVIQGLEAGADGYLLKDASPEAFISGVAAVAAGKHVMEPAIARQVAALLGTRGSGGKRFYDGLTLRERQILTLIAHGFMAKEIAHDLRISQKTVRNHVSNVYRKLGIFDRSQAILYAIKMGMVAAE